MKSAGPSVMLAHFDIEARGRDAKGKTTLSSNSKLMPKSVWNEFKKPCLTGTIAGFPRRHCDLNHHHLHHYQSSLLPPLSLSLPLSLSPPPLSSLEESLDELELSDELKLSDEQLELELSDGVELSDEQFELELSLLNRLAMLEPLLPPPLLEP